MKLLRSQQVYADAIHGRVAQIEEKKTVQLKIKQDAAAYHEIILQQVTEKETLLIIR
jgi:hypothetical protein